MTTSTTLLDQARRLARAGALAIVPLAAAAALPPEASGQVVFNPNADVVYNTSGGFYDWNENGTVAGTALPEFNAITGVKFTGGTSYTFNTDSSSGGTLVQMVNFGASEGNDGSFTEGQRLPVFFLFDLNIASAGSGGALITGFDFTLTLDTFQGTRSTSFTQADVANFAAFTGSQTFSLNSEIVLAELGSGGGFLGYSGNLSVSVASYNPGDELSVNIPDGSVDFNPVPIPEPGTSALLLLGAVGVVGGLVRRRRLKR